VPTVIPLALDDATPVEEPKPEPLEPGPAPPVPKPLLLEATPTVAPSGTPLALVPEATLGPPVVWAVVDCAPPAPPAPDDDSKMTLPPHAAVAEATRTIPRALSA
jgi:hypothetical protein